MKQYSLSTRIGTLDLPYKVYIGAGVFKGAGDVTEACKIEDLSVIMIGSYTEESRTGNPAPNYHYEETTGTSINSMGLPNGGKDYLKDNLKEMVREANIHGKKLGLSVSGKTPQENFDLFKIGIDAGVEVFEINTACGNVLDATSRSMPIACYNYELVRQMIGRLSFLNFDKSRHAVLLKVGSYANYADIDQLAPLITHSKFIDGVVTTNTFKSKIIKKNGEPAIAPDNSFGGIGGKPLKTLCLGQVAKWREVLPEHMSVVAVGGIFTGDDVAEYEEYGANGFQLVTSYLQNKRRPEILAEIGMRYAELRGIEM